MGIQINGNTNNINAGIGSLSIEDLREIDIVGVATASNFKTGTSNVHSTGYECTNINATGVVTATKFVGPFENTGDFTIDDYIVHAGDTNTFFGFPAADTITAETGGSERLRINSVGDLLLGAHGSRIFDDSSGTNVVVDIYGGTTAGKRGILALGGRTGSDNGDIGTIQFVNENNNLATAANHVQSKLVASIDVKSETTDNNSGSDSGGHLLFSTKPETGQITERLRVTSVGDVGIGTAIPVNSSNYGNLSLAGGNGGQLELKQVSTDIRHYIWGNNNLNIAGGYANGSSSNVRFFVNGNNERLKITSTGLIVTGNGTAPNSTDTGSIFMPGGADLGWLTSSGSITFNSYYSGGWKYVTTGTSHILWGDSGGFNFSTASSGSADGNISYSRAMKIHTNNRISIGDGNSTTPLGALHINTKSTMGTDTALYIGSNSDNRYMTINQTSGSEQFSHMDLVFNDNGSRSMINLKNPYGPAGFGAAITWKGYNNGTQGYIECKSEGANSATGSMYLNTTSGTFLQGNSSRHVTMPEQPSFSASRNAGAVYNGSTIIFNVVDFNNGSHYNNSNGTFTAPTAGKYQFSVAGMAAGGNSDFQVRIQKNGSNYFNNNGSGRGQSTFEPYGFTVLMNLAANDTVNCTIYSSNASSYFYGSGTVWNKFSGSLIA